MALLRAPASQPHSTGSLSLDVPRAMTQRSAGAPCLRTRTDPALASPPSPLL